MLQAGHKVNTCMAAQLVNGSLNLGGGDTDSAAVSLKGRRYCPTQPGRGLIYLSCKSNSPIRLHGLRCLISCMEIVSQKLRKRYGHEIPMRLGCELGESASREGLHLWHC